MDEEISKWIIEFLLRQKLDEKIINGVLESLPLKDEDNHRLKKTLLLRKIEFEASNASISEKILDWLEIIEEIDHSEGKSSSDSMKKAYCDVAVDCTVRFLDEIVENNAKYSEAVKRVWRERVCKIEGLASEQSERRLREIEAAVWDSEACEELLGINTRKEALRSIRVYLAEAWASLGPTFLELVAEKAGNALQELRAGGGEPPVVPAAEPCRESHADGETPKAQASVRRKRVAVRSKRSKGAKISDAKAANEDELMGNASHNPSPEVENMKVNPPSVPQTTQTLPSAKAADNTNSETSRANQTHPETRTPPEVKKTQKAPKSSLVESDTAMKDPLQAAETRTSSRSEPVIVKERGPENTETGVENAASANPQDNEPQQYQIKLHNNSNCNLMEPNGTAHAYLWDDDSIDKLPEGSSKRPCLPSPTEIKPHSPLKGYEYTKLTRKRTRKKWTQLEEDTLKTGVQKFGKGNWKLIWHCYREIFRERTEVDLKDKWRNMTR